MADYTKINLREVEDQAPKFGMAPDVEFRMARVPLACENSGLSYLRLAPNYRLPFGHKHKQQEEIYILVGGSARMKLEDEIAELAQWTAVRVPKDTTRGIEAGPEGAELLVTGAPNTGPGDAETLPGWWSD